MDLNLIFIIIYNVKPTWWNKFNYQLVYLFPLDKSKMLDWNSNYLVKMIVAIFHPIIDIWSTWMWEFFFFIIIEKDRWLFFIKQLSLKEELAIEGDFYC